MKLTAKLYRVTTIRTAELVASIGLDPETEIEPSRLMSKVKAQYAPVAPRIQFWNSGMKTVVGIEIMAFDVNDVNVPMAGLVSADPLAQHEIDRVDGALESELNRMGIGTNFVGYEYRMAYEVKGN